MRSCLPIKYPGKCTLLTRILKIFIKKAEVYLAPKQTRRTFPNESNVRKLLWHKEVPVAQLDRAPDF